MRKFKAKMIAIYTNFRAKTP